MYATGSGCHCSGWFIFSFPAAVLSQSPWTVTAEFFPVLTYSGKVLLRAKGKGPGSPWRAFDRAQRWGGGAPVTQAFSLQVTCLSIGGNLSLCLTQLRAAMQKRLSGCSSSTQLGPPSEKCGNEGEEIDRQGHGQKELPVWGGHPSWGTQCPSSPHSQVCSTAEIKVNDEGHSLLEVLSLCYSELSFKPRHFGEPGC